MNRKLQIVLFVLLIVSKSYGQYENIWVFSNGVGLNFNNGSPTNFTSTIDAWESSASVCDKNGQLLFYTDGYNFWNRNGTYMPNGQEILGGPPVFNINPISSTSQGSLIVPMPEAPNRYYVFSLTAFEISNNAHKLYYSIVNMDLDGGLGDIEPGAKGILIDSGMTELMTAVQGDRCNIWLLTVGHFENKIKALSITASGIDPTPVLSDLMQVNFGAFQGIMSVSPNRRRIAINRFGLGLYDFDPATGIATGKVPLTTMLTPQTGRGGVAFSSNSSKVYAAVRESGDYVFYQFDLSSNDSATIANSKFLLGNQSMMAVKLAPNNKIYTSDYSSDDLGVINRPNLAGAACQFQPQVAIGPLSINMKTAGFPNAIAYIERDTSLTSQDISAGCFADINPPVLQANTTTGWDYIWNDGSGETQLTATVPGVYWVRYRTPPCVFHTDTFHVAFPFGVLPKIQVRAGCKNDANGSAYAYTYTGDTVSYHYTWTNTANDTLSITDTLSDVAAGNYFLHVHTAHCDTLLPINIPEEDHDVSFEADTLICKDDVLLFSNTSDNHFTTFNWDFGDNNTSVDQSPSHTYTLPGNYLVRLIGIGNICTDTAYRNITVDEPVSQIPFTKDKNEICTGQAIVFSPSADSTITGLLWDFGDESGMESDLETIQHAYDRPGNIFIKLTTRFRACPEVIFLDSIQVHPMPLVDLGPDTVLCLHGEPIKLYNHNEYKPGDRFTWSTGDTTLQIEARHHGLFTLTVTSIHGCTTSENVTVNKDCYIDIPNAFTPNGDGVNDYFFPRQLLSRKVTGFSMKVFNRWGAIIFETNKIDGRGWDGRLNEKDQPSGVYIYLIDVDIAGSKQERYQGNVTLLR